MDLDELGGSIEINNNNKVTYNDYFSLSAPPNSFEENRSQTLIIANVLAP